MTAALDTLEGSARPAAPFRLHALDGIRGWAAFSVLLFHVFWETFGILVPQFRNPVTAGLMNGAFDVDVFFVLSGDALSAAFFERHDRAPVLRAAVSRYPRLVLPILAGTAIVFALMTAGLVFSAPAAAIVMRPDWLGHFGSFAPSLGGALGFAFRDVFIAVTNDSYMPFLWTMRTELVGSVLVFALLLGHARLRRPMLWTALLAVGLVAARSPLACFMLGLLLGQARGQGFFDRARARLSPLAIAGGALLLYAAVCFTQLHPKPGSYLNMVLAAACLLLIYSSARLSDFFGFHPVSKFLGLISFPLYLVHYAVLISLMSWLILALSVDGHLALPAILCIAAVTISASLAAAFAFTPVEALTRRFNRWLARLVLRKPPRR
jgi:peptidoglycan/LPS O-acetylase OafA/YrhL